MLWKTVLRVSYWTLCLWWRICTEIICNNIAYKTVIFLLGLAMNILSTISVLTRIMVVKTEKKRRNRQERLVDNRKQNHNFLHFVFTSVCPSQHTIPRHPWYFAFSSNRKKDQFLSTQKSEIEHHYHQQQQQQQQQQDHQQQQQHRHNIIIIILITSITIIISSSSNNNNNNNNNNNKLSRVPATNVHFILLQLAICLPVYTIILKGANLVTKKVFV